MVDDATILTEALKAFHAGYAGPPGTIKPRQAGKTAAGVAAVLDHLRSCGLLVASAPAHSLIGMDMASGPDLTVISNVNERGEHQVVETSCKCPEHGSWIHAEDINRMVLEIDVAMYGETAAKAPKLCDIVGPVIDMIEDAKRWRFVRELAWFVDEANRVYRERYGEANPDWERIQDALDEVRREVANG